jgi:hypothetical protein
LTTVSVTVFTVVLEQDEIVVWLINKISANVAIDNNPFIMIQFGVKNQCLSSEMRLLRINIKEKKNGPYQARI